MSIEISVYIRPDKMVTPKQWKDAIVELGYDIQLDDDIDIKEFSGFLPVIHKGNASGFEYYYDELDQEDRTSGTSYSSLVKHKIDKFKK